MKLVYKEKHAKKFVKDMTDAGLSPYHYHGRYYYHGPAVNCQSWLEAMRSTRVNCTYDQMGKGFVVYPRVSATLVSKEEDYDPED